MAHAELMALATRLVEKYHLSKDDAATFVSAFFEVLQQGLEEDRIVKVKGLGTFKLITVKDRESVDVNTGERIVIEGRDKISFTPDKILAELINKPFAQFDTVVVNEGVDFSEIDREFQEKESTVGTIPNGGPSSEGRMEPERTAAPAEPTAPVNTAAASETVTTESAATEPAATDVPTATAESAVSVDAAAPAEPVVPDTPVATTTPDKPVATMPVEPAKTTAPVAPAATTAAPTAESVAPNPTSPDVSENAASVSSEPTASVASKPETPVPSTSEAPVSSSPVSPVAPTVSEENSAKGAAPRYSLSRFSFYFFCGASVVLLVGLIVISFLYGRVAGERDNLQAQVGLLKQQVNMIQAKTDQPTAQEQVQREKAQADSIRLLRQHEALEAQGGAETADGTPEETAGEQTQTVDEQKATAAQKAAAQKAAKKAAAEKEQQTANKYAKAGASDPRVRTGAYEIVGIDHVVTVKAGQTLQSIARSQLGPGMECYIEAVNGSSAVKAGEKIKIPKVKLKKK
ncbi:MAG: HU family DNA-binding protein [Prevotellaceae bacterium]|nr:HU family DNA-binding protein [Prevotellaceae bacterium]